MAQYRLPRSPSSMRPRRAARITIIVVFILILLGARTLAGIAIDYQWWKEVGQLDTWLNMYLFSVGPLAVATVLAFAALWITHARAMKFAKTALAEHGGYSKLSAVALLFLGSLVSSASLDTWTVVRFAGSLHIPVTAAAWRDPVFARPLAFYLF